MTPPLIVGNEPWPGGISTGAPCEVSDAGTDGPAAGDEGEGELDLAWIPTRFGDTMVLADRVETAPTLGYKTERVPGSVNVEPVPFSRWSVRLMGTEPSTCDAISINAVTLTHAAVDLGDGTYCVMEYLGMERVLSAEELDGWCVNERVGPIEEWQAAVDALIAERQ
jgi:hypothetical protein